MDLLNQVIGLPELLLLIGGLEWFVALNLLYWLLVRRRGDAFEDREARRAADLLARREVAELTGRIRRMVEAVSSDPARAHEARHLAGGTTPTALRFRARWDHIQSTADTEKPADAVARARDLAEVESLLLGLMAEAPKTAVAAKPHAAVQPRRAPTRLRDHLRALRCRVRGLLRTKTSRGSEPA